MADCIRYLKSKDSDVDQMAGNESTFFICVK